MNSSCKKHTYVFQGNTTIMKSRSNVTGTSMRISFRGLYKCSVCRKEYIGKSKSVPNETSPLNDLFRGDEQ